MESPRKFNDCYFYYYSTCTKGDNCIFRHEPSALGCETMCSAWQQGKCMDKCCKLRHMELRKNRKQIACYWENQPGGCRKKHCPFMHKNPDARTDGIAPSQPIPVGNPMNSLPEAVEGVPVSGPPPAPAPVPLLWQQQRQQGPPLVLDSAILGVLPGTNELVPRRVVAAHAHAHAHAHGHGHAHAHAHPHEQPAPYAQHAPHAPLPVDPLVVNFEEESDNESAPSSTPTKSGPSDDAQRIARSKSQELLLLEKIQAEAAALYSYDSLPATEPAAKERKIVRTNLATKYDRLSLDEIAGKKQSAERRNSLDFKVLSLDEIKARKKISEAVLHTTPITLKLNRKRKLSTHETLTTSGNKILKVVRSNSVVYKKLDQNAPAQPSQGKLGPKRSEDASRKRTISEISDIYDMREDELEDKCYEFKRIKIDEQIPKPRLVRNRSTTKSISETRSEEIETVCSKEDVDSDTEVQFVSMEIREMTTTDLSQIDDDVIIDVDSAKISDPVYVVDLCEDGEITASDLDLVKNVPDVVASCQKNLNKNESVDTDLLNSIDAYLSEDL